MFLAIYDDLYELCAKRGTQPGITRFDSEVVPRLFDEGLSEDQIADSVEILEGKALLQYSPVMAASRLQQIGPIQPTHLGMKRYLQVREADLDSIMHRVATEISNHELPKTQRVLKHCDGINTMTLYFTLEEFDKTGLESVWK